MVQDPGNFSSLTEEDNIRTVTQRSPFLFFCYSFTDAYSITGLAEVPGADLMFAWVSAHNSFVQGGPTVFHADGR
jgi:hypothetical protein